MVYTNGDRVLRTKQGAVSGAALRFLQAGSDPRRKNRLSARGNALLTSYVYCLIPYQLHDLNDLNDFLRVGKSCKSFIPYGIEQTANQKSRRRLRQLGAV